MSIDETAMYGISKGNDLNVSLGVIPADLMNWAVSECSIPKLANKYIGLITETDNIRSVMKNTDSMQNSAHNPPLIVRHRPLLSARSPTAMIFPNHTTGCGRRSGSPKILSRIHPIINGSIVAAMYEII